MKNMKIALVLALISLFCLAAMPNKKGCQSVTETFLQGILKGNVDESYDELFKGTKLADNKVGVLNLKQQTKTMAEVYGPLHNYEFVRDQEYADSILRLVYILKGERHPLICEFYFYKKASDWEIININVSDQLNLLADK